VKWPEAMQHITARVLRPICGVFNLSKTL